MQNFKPFLEKSKHGNKKIKIDVISGHNIPPAMLKGSTHTLLGPMLHWHLDMFIANWLLHLFYIPKNGNEIFLWKMYHIRYTWLKLYATYRRETRKTIWYYDSYFSFILLVFKKINNNNRKKIWDRDFYFKSNRGTTIKTILFLNLLQKWCISSKM